MGNRINNITFKMKFAAALLATVAARHHHHHHNVEFVNEEASLEAMSDAQLVSNLESTLHSALKAEARDDKAAAVAKTAPSRTSRRLLPLESSRDSMMDNHSLRSLER